MANFIIVAVVAVIIGLAGYYIYKEKKNGQKCIGCPNGCSCGANAGSCGCGCDCGCGK
ncbi:MAG: FeoB-associated Cys-rich membrane protein [Oscillospiraceae bacterium]|nr:FeoB-associated Cys-rich membrane protein [Oscillospiraceae bacterium]